MKEIIILASGNGSNFESICVYFSKSKSIRVKQLITDNKDAFVIQRAKKLNVDYKIIDYHCFNNKSEYNHTLFEHLKSFNFDLIVLAGYMRILPDYIVNYYKGKIINIHPSLLPNYKGINAIVRAFENKEKYTGITIHYVDEGVDTGKIIFQKKVRTKKSDTIESLEKRIHKIEHKTYPKIIKRVLAKNN
ncbi:MAG: phosphoribosylglycinamide formyltransferase [Defluviitoga tunisiensis]